MPLGGGGVDEGGIVDGGGVVKGGGGMAGEFLFIAGEFSLTCGG